MAGFFLAITWEYNQHDWLEPWVHRTSRDVTISGLLTMLGVSILWLVKSKPRENFMGWVFWGAVISFLATSFGNFLLWEPVVIPMRNSMEATMPTHVCHWILSETNVDWVSFLACLMGFVFLFEQKGAYDYFKARKAEQSARRVRLLKQAGIPT
jgi:Na+/H+ antiporter NhaD/arsenite permease-like protein